MTDPVTANLATWVDHWRNIARQHETEKVQYRINIGRALAQLNIGRPGKAREILTASMLTAGEVSTPTRNRNAEMLDALNEVQRRIDDGDLVAAQHCFVEGVRRFTSVGEPPE